jgi:cytochrome c peroxidase
MLQQLRWVGAGLVLVGLGMVSSNAGGLVQGLASASTPPPCVPGGVSPKGCLFELEIEEGTPLASLKTADKPQDPHMGEYLADRTALLQLGKALFWDQQVGSDGQACASCHFAAGADPRAKNQISPGLKATPVNHTFTVGQAPNATLQASDFPLHKLADPNNRNSQVLRDSDDVVSSQGVMYRTFISVPTFPFSDSRGQNAFDTCRSVADPDKFQVAGMNTRRVEPRNTPTVINALFNARNFWDGRAQETFNGVDPFGARSTDARVYSFGAAGLAAQVLRVSFSSLASQAVGPPENPFEMSCDGRKFPDVGHKLLGVKPLGQQFVATDDSVLGALSMGRVTQFNKQGLTVSYATLIQRAFQPRWWASPQGINLGGKVYSQMEANFSMFFGLAAQAYMESLVADDTPMDRFFDGKTSSLSAQQKRGMALFLSVQGKLPDGTPIKTSDGQPADARCSICHGGAEMTAASIEAQADERIERMALANGGCAIYDAGFLNTGVRPTRDDAGVAAMDPYNNSFAETQLALLGKLSQLVPGANQPFGLDPPVGTTINCEGANIQSAFKAPQLRNVELTGPYMHNGGMATLRQVVDFYARGGDFNNPDLDSDIRPFHLTEQDRTDLVAFLLSLTDERVKFERAPFDHPSICVANGEVGNNRTVKGSPKGTFPGPQDVRSSTDDQLCIKSIGAAGRHDPLGPFLGLNQFAK